MIFQFVFGNSPLSLSTAFQNKVMRILHDAGLPVQLPQISKNGNLIELETIETTLDTQGHRGKRQHAVRLLSYLYGDDLGDIKVKRS